MGREEPITIKIDDRGIQRTLKEVIRTRQGDFVLSKPIAGMYQYKVEFEGGKEYGANPVKILSKSSPIEARAEVSPDGDILGAGEFITAALRTAYKKNLSLDGVNGFYFAGENAYRKVDNLVGRINSKVDVCHVREVVMFLCRYQEIPYLGAKLIQTESGVIDLPNRF